MTRTRAVLAALIAVLLSTLLTPTANAAAPAVPIHSITYRTWFAENFDRGDVSGGGWQTGPYAQRLSVYDGFRERNQGPVQFDRNTVTVEGGRLVFFGFRRPAADGTSWDTIGAGAVPLLGGKYVGFRYGRYSFDLEAQPGPAGMGNWWFAGLLWPQSNQHCDGELDWPEMVPGQPAAVFNHIAGKLRADGSCTVNPQNTCAQKGDQSWVTTGNHRYSIRWLPDGVTYYRDGEVVMQTACSVPDVPMLLKLQLVSLNREITPDAFGKVLIDNIVVEKAYYQQG